MASVATIVDRLVSPTHLRRYSAQCILGGHSGSLHLWPQSVRSQRGSRRLRLVHGRRSVVHNHTSHTRMHTMEINFWVRVQFQINSVFGLETYLKVCNPRNQHLEEQNSSFRLI